MGKISRIDWESVYEAFDGNMSECKGANCPSPCCTEKSIRVYGGPRVLYRTSFSDSDEALYQRRLSPDLDELGVQVVRADVGDDRMNIKHLVSNCLRGDGSCALSGRKPFACRMKPFMFYAFLPLDLSCPFAREIARNQEIVERFLAVRSRLFAIDNDEWRAALQKQIAS